MERRVTGIGGVFFKAKGDVKELNAWYEKHLGMDYTNSGGYPFWEWRTANDPNKIGSTVFSIFNKDSKYFGNPDQQFMFNLRVENLKELLEALQSEGVNVIGEMQEFDYGKFAWIEDPEGNKIELWESSPDTGFTGGMPMY